MWKTPRPLDRDDRILEILSRERIPAACAGCWPVRPYQNLKRAG